MGIVHAVHNGGRCTFLRQHRTERIQQSKVLSLQRGRLFCNRQDLRCHGKREMTNNGTNCVLMPVINGIIRPTSVSLKQSKSWLKLTFAEGS